jgi:mediator of RNA polymerase II transcription subunit 12
LLLQAYLYDLAAACPALLKSSDKYPVLKRLFYQTLDRSTSMFPLSDQFREMIAPYIQQPKKKVDPLIVRYLHEKPEHQYTLVVSVISAILLGQLDNDRLNDLAILCSELTAQCSSLAPEWLGALYSLCCADEASYGCLQPLQLGLRPGDQQSFCGPLAIFVSILIARQCFSLQAVVVNVITRSLVKAWGKGEGQPSPESEAGARLALNLLLRLFRSVECFQPGSYTVAASPRAAGPPSSNAAQEALNSNSTGIKFSCDRHLLSATHANISTGIPVGAIIAVLKAMLLLGDSVPRTLNEGGGGMPSSLHLLSVTDDLAGRSDQGQLSLGELAHLALMQICSQDWVRDRCLQLPDDLCKQGFLLDNYLPAQQAQHLLRLICHTTDTGSEVARLAASNKSGDHHHHQQQPDRVIARMIRDLDEWSLRASMIDIKLMYLLEKKGGESVSSWLEDVSKCIIEAFKLGENNNSGGGSDHQEDAAAVSANNTAGIASSDEADKADDMEDDDDVIEGEPRRKKRKLEQPSHQQRRQYPGGGEEEESKKRQRKFGPIWMIPHLVKGLKFLQTKILQAGVYVLLPPPPPR